MMPAITIQINAVTIGDWTAASASEPKSNPYLKTPLYSLGKMRKYKTAPNTINIPGASAENSHALAFFQTLNERWNVPFLPVTRRVISDITTGKNVNATPKIR